MKIHQLDHKLEGSRHNVSAVTSQAAVLRNFKVWNRGNNRYLSQAFLHCFGNMLVFFNVNAWSTLIK
jgi:hypothetical protein